MYTYEYMFGEREIEEEKKMEQIKIHLWAVKALPLHLTSISIVMCYSFCECASGQICSYFHLCSNAVQSSGFLFSLYLFSTKNKKINLVFFPISIVGLEFQNCAVLSDKFICWTLSARPSSSDATYVNRIWC